MQSRTRPTTAVELISFPGSVWERPACEASASRTPSRSRAPSGHALKAVAPAIPIRLGSRVRSSPASMNPLPPPQCLTRYPFPVSRPTSDQPTESLAGGRLVTGLRLNAVRLVFRIIFESEAETRAAIPELSTWKGRLPQLQQGGAGDGMVLAPIGKVAGSGGHQCVSLRMETSRLHPAQALES